MLLLLVSVSLAAQAAPPQAPAPEPIVVTGRRIADAKAALNACLARNCPPDEDIDASIALAETQIVAGDYRDARSTLLRALSRNHDEARRYPIPVSDLYRANGRVAAHLGYDRDYYRSTWGIYRALKEGIPDPTYRHFSARMEIAEMMYRTRGHDRARLYYAEIADDAREAGRPDIAALAELRSIIRHLPPYMREKRIRMIADSKDPKLRAAVLEAKLALARMAYERNDAQAAAEIQRDFAAMNIKKPILIYAPPYEVSDGPTSPNEIGAMVARQAGAPVSAGSDPGSGGPRFGSPAAFPGHAMALNIEDMWIDVGFRITPSGEVADVQVLRSSGETFWTRPILASISGRRYTPARAGDPAAERVERYTYTAGYEAQTRTRMAGRSPKPRIEYFDLSPMGIVAPN